MKKVELQGGCYVLSEVWGGESPLVPLIGEAFGANHISQLGLEVAKPSPILHFGRSDVILFIVEGRGEAKIGGHTFPLEPRSGLYIRPGESFQVLPSTSPPPCAGGGMPAQGGHDKELKLLLTVCPEEAEFRVLKTMPEPFDSKFQNRLAAIDPAKREAMGERFFQILVSKPLGSKNVTQFIGEIPKSRAPSHHHPYEEALYVISGEGFMWTGDKKAPVKPGSVIFLPAKQEHALECTSSGGLTVAGHFYPAGSPAENY